MKKINRTIFMLALAIFGGVSAWADGAEGDKATIAMGNVIGGKIVCTDTDYNELGRDESGNYLAVPGDAVYMMATPDYNYSATVAEITVTETTGSGAAEARNIFRAPSIGQTVDVDKEMNYWYFAMPSNGCNVVIDATFAPKDMNEELVPYLDADGNAAELDAGEAFILDGTETVLGQANSTVWYYLPAGVELLAYDVRLSLQGDVNIILGDDSQLAASKGVYGDAGSSLTFFAQTTSLYHCGYTSFLNQSEPNEGENHCAITAGSVTVNGGYVSVYDAGYGIYATSDITMNNGIIQGTCTEKNIYAGGDFVFGGGIVELDNSGIYVGGDLTLGWRDKDNDHILATDYTVVGSVSTADGKRFTYLDDDSNTYIVSGTAGADNYSVNDLAGRIIIPFFGYMVSIAGDAAEDFGFDNFSDSFESNGKACWVYNAGDEVTIFYTNDIFCQVEGLPAGFERDGDNVSFPMTDGDLELTATVIDYERFTIDDLTYNGEEQTPVIKLDGEVFDTGNYEIVGYDPEECKAVDIYDVGISGLGSYFGEVDVSFVINSATVVYDAGDYCDGEITWDEEGVHLTLFEGMGSANELPAAVTTVDDFEYSRDLAAPGSDSGDKTIDGQAANLFTVCLPFLPDIDDNVTYYTLGSVTGTTLNFVEVDDAAVSEFTPYLVAVTGDSGFTISCDDESFAVDAEVVSTTVTSDKGQVFTFTGTLRGLGNAAAATVAGEGNATYILQDGAVWGKVTADNDGARIPPFRAFITGPDVDIASGARTFASTFSNGGGQATAIGSIRTVDKDGTERWYDLNGRRIAKPAKNGVYIRDGKKVSAVK